jgi:hypothetical protein
LVVLRSLSQNIVNFWSYNGTSTHNNFSSRGFFIGLLGIEPDIEKRKVICYSRVSGGDQKDDLKNQQKALEQYAISNGIAVDDWLSDFGSGLLYPREI